MGHKLDTTIFKTDLWQKYLCPKCRLVLKDAVQPSCGHWLCQSCADAILAPDNENLPVCPRDDCGEELTAEDGVKYFPDRFVRREILSLPIVCSRRDRGCNWEGKFSELEDHQKQCQHGIEKCEHCGLLVGDSELEAHTLRCPEAPKQCPCVVVGCSETSSYFPDRFVRREILSLPIVCGCRGRGCNWEGKLEYFPDRFVRREILSLPIVCSCRDRGCNWEGKLENHQKQCQHGIEKCEHFGLLVGDSGYFPDRFVRREILSLPIVCSCRDRSCNWEGKLEYFANRFVWKEILNYDVMCLHREKGCTQRGKFAKFEKHLDGCECVRQPCENCGQLLQGQEVMAPFVVPCSMEAGHARIRKHFDELWDAISKLGMLELTVKAYSKGLITDQIKDAVFSAANGTSLGMKAGVLLSAIQEQIKTAPNTFDIFLEILRSEPAYQHLADKLTNDLSYSC